IANNSSNARVIARTPAPPVSTSVPSMSNRMSVVSAASLAFAANVSCSRPLGRRFLLEAHALPFVQLIEAALDRAAMEEPLLSAVVSNEPEPTVSNESLDRTARYRVSLGPARIAQGVVSIFVPVERHPIRAHFAGTVTAERKVRRQKNTGVYKTSAPHRACGRASSGRPGTGRQPGVPITDVVQ